jgi:hypothetical protein
MSGFIGMGAFEYPAPKTEEQHFYGVYPVDFLLETILKAGLEWFRTDPQAPKYVFGHLMSPYLSKYGEAKIEEIAAFIKKYDIRIVQHWALIAEKAPCISIQLLDGTESIERAGLADFQQMVDTLNADNEVIGRRDVGYSPITDNIHIGIHTKDTPDLAKYLYYLVVYVLNSFKPQLEMRGMMLGTFRATDLSRMNEYLPDNMYSRFINFTIFTMASFDKGVVPIIEEFMGLNVAPSSQGAEGLGSSEEIDSEFGISICVKENEDE